jgi:hypothetical protein
MFQITRQSSQGKGYLLAGDVILMQMSCPISIPFFFKKRKTDRSSFGVCALELMVIIVFLSCYYGCEKIESSSFLIGAYLKGIKTHSVTWYTVFKPPLYP